MFNIHDYATVSRRYNGYPEFSLYKNIPIQHLDDVRAFFKLRGMEIRIRYRGSRTNPNDKRTARRRQCDCVREFADRFSVYSRCWT